MVLSYVQGLIAEIVAHEDAMDLFRHTTDIGVHVSAEMHTKAFLSLACTY